MAQVADGDVRGAREEMPVSLVRSSTRVPVLLSYLDFVLGGVGAAATGVLLPAQMQDYGVDMATIGLTFFTGAAGFFLAGTATGPLIHRFGTRWTLVLGAAVFASASAVTATRPPFALLVAVVAVSGLGSGIAESALNVYLSTLPSATTLLNRLHAFFGVGALLGPVVAVQVLRRAPWTAVFAVLAVVSALLAVGFALCFREQPPPDDAEPHRGGTLRTAVRSRAVVLASVFLTVYVGLEVTVGNWSYTYLVERYDLGVVTAGYAVSGYWLGLTLGRFLISPVGVRLGLTPERMVLLCLGGVTAATLLAWLAPAGTVAAAGLVLVGFFLGPLFPTAMAVVPRLTSPLLVPTAIGLMNAVSVVGGAALPWLAGAGAEQLGIGLLLPYVLVLGLVQLVLWRALARRMAPLGTAVPAG